MAFLIQRPNLLDRAFNYFPWTINHIIQVVINTTTKNHLPPGEMTNLKIYFYLIVFPSVFSTYFIIIIYFLWIGISGGYQWIIIIWLWVSEQINLKYITSGFQYMFYNNFRICFGGSGMVFITACHSKGQKFKSYPGHFCVFYSLSL